MKLYENLNDALNGVYGGLYAEVVTHDTYQVKELAERGWAPDVIFDIGANIGIFSRFARELFPHAMIVAVEPDPHNQRMWEKFTNDSNTVLLKNALGRGKLYHGTTARNGSGETYLSSGLGYPKDMMNEAAQNQRGLEFTTVFPLMLNEIVNRYRLPNMSFLLKIDCEGAENVIWGHEGSMQILHEADYLAMELHDYALTGGLLQEVKDTTQRALDELKKSHRTERNGVHFWALHKETFPEDLWPK